MAGWPGKLACVPCRQQRREKRVGLALSHPSCPTAQSSPVTRLPACCRYDKEGEPSFASARLWDDGVIQPQDSRAVLGLSLAATLNRPPADTRFGVFRM